MGQIMIEIDNVSKIYKLGQIGGTTLREDLQRKTAKLLHKEDPTRRIDQKDQNFGEEFYALKNISFKVNQGERIGIIGHNGAGKSTLLKVLSRITAPSTGSIGLNGRIASMLEVGTGFHPELTGRENIYMNGAILGMTKKEIDAKIEDIIEFSECRQFIDTPVKRYSSGMYVKLAFSVAAHLDSEIMIMDEVLAVGDMAFQRKCLDKMNDVSRKDGRTILYVSHNMSTIRQLCDRCIVLEHGEMVFDGDVEEGIAKYLLDHADADDVDIDLSKSRMKHLPTDISAKMTRLQILDKSKPLFEYDEKVKFNLTIHAEKDISDLNLRFEIRTKSDTPVGLTMKTGFSSIKKNQDKTFTFVFNPHGLVTGQYRVCLVLYEGDEYGQFIDLDAIYPALSFEVADTNNKLGLKWQKNNWGSLKFDDMQVSPLE